MEKKRIISVIIPVYNRAHLIESLLNKLAEQSFIDFEIIIVDDCSSDSEQLVTVLDGCSLQTPSLW